MVSYIKDNDSISVYDIHLPGDIVGLNQMIYSRADHTTYCVSNAKFCPFPRQHLDDLVVQSPRLAAILHINSLIDKSILHDRLSMICTRDAHVRLCHFLLQLLFRLRFMNNDLRDQYYCPLNQTAIGDAIGVTSVHVSRMFSRLAEMNLISRQRNFIKFLDLQKAINLCGFVDRYSEIRVDWLPEG